MQALAAPGYQPKPFAVSPAIDHAQIRSILGKLLLGAGDGRRPVAFQLIFPTGQERARKIFLQQGQNFRGGSQLGQERILRRRNFCGANFFQLPIGTARPDFAKSKIAHGRRVEDSAPPPGGQLLQAFAQILSGGKHLAGHGFDRQPAGRVMASQQMDFMAIGGEKIGQFSAERARGKVG
jgi:hypothetical protein